MLLIFFSTAVHAAVYAVDEVMGTTEIVSSQGVRRTVIEETPSEVSDSTTTPVTEVLEEREETPLPVVPVVPFFSQFTDIHNTSWQKVGCGIASLAMLIEYYVPGEVGVDTLLGEGIASHAYLDTAGWTHQGLVNLAIKHGLTGSPHYLGDKDADTAFALFSKEVARGPVMASVHYTFEPTNPIPHLVIVTGIADGKVHYNDPAESTGGGSITIHAFKKAWKQKYIVIRPGL